MRAEACVPHPGKLYNNLDAPAAKKNETTMPHCRITSSLDEREVFEPVMTATTHEKARHNTGLGQ
eukprot:5884881-Amphidinium_carterae.1